MRRLTALACILLLLSACAAPPAGGGGPEEAGLEETPETVRFFAMDTVMALTAYGPEARTAAEEAEARVLALEEQLSRTLEDSAVSRLNADGEAEAEGALWELLLAAAHYHRETGGAFDITVAPLASAWGFAADRFRVPSQAEREALLALVDGSAVALRREGEQCTAALGPGQSIDLGAIAKGYASDQAAAVFSAHGVSRGKAELGGNILAWGTRPDGNPWRVGIQDPARPEDPGAFVGVLELESAFAITSGGYQRYFEENGKRYHHILDPFTGAPADSGLTSVTVVAAAGGEHGGNGAMCDAYSTALFILGEEAALEFWRSHQEKEAYEDAFDLVLVTEDGRVVVTAGLADRFAPASDGGYVYETAS